MESLRVRTTLNLADWNAFLLEAGTRTANLETGHWLTRHVSSAIWLLLVAISVVMLNTEPPMIRPAGIAITLAGFFGIWWIQYYIQRRAYKPSEGGTFLGDHEFVFETGGFHSRRRNSDAFNRWSLVTDVTHTESHLFLWIDRHSGYAIAARDLPAPMTAAAAAEQLRKFMAAAAEESNADLGFVSSPAAWELCTTPAPDATQLLTPPAPPTVAQELLALARLHAWGLVDGARLYGRDVTLLLLGLLSMGLWIGLDRLGYEGDVELFIYGITENTVMVVAVLAIAWILSRVSRPRIEMRQGLLLVLGFLPWDPLESTCRHASLSIL